MIYLMRHGLDDENYIGGWSEVDLVEEESINHLNKEINKWLSKITL